MEKILQIGDKLVIMDENMDSIHSAANDIRNVAKENDVDLLAVIEKGEDHRLTMKWSPNGTTYIEDLSKILTLIHGMAETWEIDAEEIAEQIYQVIKEGE